MHPDKTCMLLQANRRFWMKERNTNLPLLGPCDRRLVYSSSCWRNTRSNSISTSSYSQRSSVQKTAFITTAFVNFLCNLSRVVFWGEYQIFYPSEGYYWDWGSQSGSLKANRNKCGSKRGQNKITLWRKSQVLIQLTYQRLQKTSLLFNPRCTTNYAVDKYPCCSLREFKRMEQSCTGLEYVSQKFVLFETRSICFEPRPHMV